MKYKTIFFDLDDTLVDTRRNAKNALKEIYDQLKINEYYPNFEDFALRYNTININLWDRYEHSEITKDELISQRFKHVFSSFRQLSDKESIDINSAFLEIVVKQNTCIEGTLDILDYLHSKYPMYILSNGFVEIQDKKMKNAGISKYFQKVILSEHIGRNKPHPDIFSYALDKAKATSNWSIMIGDNIATDITGAKNSCIDQIWFNPENKQTPTEISPTYTIHKLCELKNIL